VRETQSVARAGAHSVPRAEAMNGRDDRDSRGTDQAIGAKPA
jgi:hypothetical protein